VKKDAILSSVKLALVIAGLGVVSAVTVRADCGISANQLSIRPRLAVATMPDGVSLDDERAVEASGAEATPRADDGQGASIVGLWKSTFTSGGQVVDQGFDQWSSDGTEILNDDPAPATGNVCLGVYVKSGPSTYKLKHPSWTFDAAGNLTGAAIIREQVTVAPGGNSYKGPFTIDIYDLSGNHLAHFSGTITAQRITVDF
jgi:hypothetical protein